MSNILTSGLENLSKDVLWQMMATQFKLDDIKSICTLNDYFKSVCTDKFWKYWVNTKYKIQKLPRTYPNWKHFAFSISEHALTSEDIQKKNYKYVSAHYPYLIHKKFLDDVYFFHLKILNM